METYLQQDDIQLFGTRIATFPNGITEAFDNLLKMLGSERPYYGVSWCAEDGRVVYYAMAAERVAGEAKPYGYETLTLPTGEYRAEKLDDWMSRTDCIKEVFRQLTEGVAPSKDNPCIEWYLSDKEMLCMVKNPRKSDS